MVNRATSLRNGSSGFIRNAVIGRDGISDPHESAPARQPDTRVEVLCNRSAGAVLVPAGHTNTIVRDAGEAHRPGQAPEGSRGMRLWWHALDESSRRRSTPRLSERSWKRTDRRIQLTELLTFLC
jgi:hypothetical protein